MLLAGKRAAAIEALADAIAVEPDMELVGIVPTTDGLARMAVRERIDVLITEALEDDSTQAYAELLFQWPGLRVLAIAWRGPEVVLYELQPTKVTLGNVSLDGLIEAIRRNVSALVAASIRTRET